MQYLQSTLSGILGVATGDAVGVPAEFSSRADLQKNPITDMTGYGSHGQPAGTWSDDTSMTLCLVNALIYSGDKPDNELVMHNFSRWFHEKKFTATDCVFDCGGTCLAAIDNYVSDHLPAVLCGSRDGESCGNGALMRILPALFWVHRFYGSDFVQNEEARQIVYDLTSLTHGHEKCLMANLFYLSIAGKLLDGANKTEAFEQGVSRVWNLYEKDNRFAKYLSNFAFLKDPALAEKPEEVILSGGYVLESLEASVWSLLTTEDYESCILRAVNLSHDTDTTAAIAGGLAGLCYGIGGEKGIPQKWLTKLKKKDEIEEFCQSLAKRLED